jgi:Uma2 family endonuclease
MTLAEFLALPEEKPYLEFINGEVVQKPLPTEPHGTLTSELIGELRDYLKVSGKGRVRNEVRHLYDGAEEERVYLPGVHVTLNSSRRGRAGQNPVRPETETITVYRPGAPLQVARTGAILDARPVLRDFSLDVGKLFAVVSEEGHA